LKDSSNYNEQISSSRTEALFLSLTLLFLLLSIWRVNAIGFSLLSGIFFFLFIFFLFYSLNYRTLILRLSPELLELRFGLFIWTMPLNNVENCFLDDTSLWRIGGAGIHFSPMHGRYRAMFNFLEYPRVVIALKRKKGLVRDIAFSTRQPEEVLRFIRDTRLVESATWPTS
jgi:hypothetical protein